jgi:hypothetical protein
MLFETVSDPVSDGKHVVLMMLATGLVFIAVVLIGELVRWAGHRRAERKRQLRTY